MAASLCYALFGRTYSAMSVKADMLAADKIDFAR